MRVVEHGPSIGEHKARAIPSYIVDETARRYDFVRIAVLDGDGGFDLDTLACNETIIAPGLIYSLKK